MIPYRFLKNVYSNIYASLLVLAVLWIQSLPVVAQVTLSVSSDKEVYDYGEPIKITVRMENNTPNIFTINGSSSCQADFKFDAYDHSQRPCTTDLIEIRFNPGAWRAWTWVLDPQEIGLPKDDGSHTIVGFYGSQFTDSITVYAPAFLGGQLIVTLPSGTSESPASVKDSLNAEVLYSYQSGQKTNEVWRISGMTVDSAIERWGTDVRFSSFEAWRVVSEYFITKRERTPEIPAPQSKPIVFPNPCTSTCQVEVDLGVDTTPTITIHDMLGGSVAMPVSIESSGLGLHRFKIDVSNQMTGVYAVSVRAGSQFKTQIVIISR